MYDRLDTHRTGDHTQRPCCGSAAVTETPARKHYMPPTIRLIEMGTGTQLASGGMTDGTSYAPPGSPAS